MDKKIILSVLIVALIGIVAATYQITPGQDILNPLASVNTEDTPVTEVLTAPEESQQQAQAKAESQAKQQAQAEAQAQQAKDQADAKAQAENTQPDSSAAGSASQSAIVNSENPVTISSSSNSGDSQSSDTSSSSSNSNTGSSSDSNSGSSSDSNSGSSSDSNSGSSSDSNSGSSSDSNSGSSSDSNSGSSNNNDNSGSSTSDSSNTQGSSTNNNQNGDSNNGQTTKPESINGPEGDEIVTDSTIDDNTWSEIDSVVQNAKNSFAFGISADRDSCSVDNNGLYSVKVYNSETKNFVGTLYVNINKNSAEYGQWYLIDAYGDTQGPDVDPNR